jgi:Glycosyltransferase family 28 C-terminal domain
LPQRKVLDFLFFDAGGGHRSAAVALKSVIDSQDRDWYVRLVNLQEVLDPLDIFRKATGIRLQDIYNLLLAKGWTLGSEYLLPMMHGIIRLYHNPEVRLLTKFWAGRKPDLVVSMIPNFNRAVFESLRAAAPGTELVTILTDFADFPPHFWIERQLQYFICGTDKAVQQALQMGHSRHRVFRVSGMILRPSFYNLPPIDRAAERIRLGLSPQVPTGLLLFGGQGSQHMLRIARSIGKLKTPVQLIAICGHNAALKKNMEGLRTGHPIHVTGFTQQVPFYMQLSDFFIGKAGPGSISEAIQMKLPVILEENSWTLPQERYNTAWVREHGVGIVLRNFRKVNEAVGSLLQPDRLAEMRQNTACLENRAVFEIPEILAGLLSHKAEQVHLSQGTKI